jgi:hypothetical protein
MMNFHYALKAKMARGRSGAYCFGGDSDSDSSTRTTSNTSNTATSTDKRAVASDQAVSLTGDGNSIDRSTSNLTQMFDSSNRSTNFADSSNRSTNFQDNSDRSVHTTYTTTDFGSVNAALTLNGAMTTKALGVADNSVQGAIDVLKLQTTEGQKTISGAFNLAQSSAANAMQNSAQVLGFASSALASTQAAYAEAKDGGQSKMMMYAIIAAGAVAVAFALKR